MTPIQSLFTHNSGRLDHRRRDSLQGEVRDLAVWCQDNNLFHIIRKAKELIVDFGKRRAEHAPIHIDGAVVEQVQSFKFLFVHITKELSWSTHINTDVKKAQPCLIRLRRLKIFGMGPQIIKMFFGCTFESIWTVVVATAWNPTARCYRR